MIELDNIYPCDFIVWAKLLNGGQGRLNIFFFCILFEILCLSTGGDNTHPGPAEAIRRIRVLTIGKDPSNFLADTNVETLFDDYNVVSKLTTEDLDVTDQPEEQEPDEPVEDQQVEEPVPTSSDSWKRNYCFKNALTYIGGYIARKVDPDNFSIDVKRYPCSWSAHLSKGGLVAPNDELHSMCETLETEFRLFHGETISLDPDPKGIFAQKMQEKYPDWPVKVIERFNNVRFHAQLRFLNNNLVKRRTVRSHKQLAQHTNQYIYALINKVNIQWKISFRNNVLGGI